MKSAATSFPLGAQTLQSLRSLTSQCDGTIEVAYGCFLLFIIRERTFPSNRQGAAKLATAVAEGVVVY
jgi:hypothetical protein